MIQPAVIPSGPNCSGPPSSSGSSSGDSGGTHHSSGPEGLGYTIWRYDGSDWTVKKDCAAEGAVTSPPPAINGKFVGQLRATACIAA